MTEMPHRLIGRIAAINISSIWQWVPQVTCQTQDSNVKRQNSAPACNPDKHSISFRSRPTYSPQLISCTICFIRIVHQDILLKGTFNSTFQKTRSSQVAGFHVGHLPCKLHLQVDKPTKEVRVAPVPVAVAPAHAVAAPAGAPAPAPVAAPMAAPAAAPAAQAGCLMVVQGNYRTPRGSQRYSDTALSMFFLKKVKPAS